MLRRAVSGACLPRRDADRPGASQNEDAADDRNLAILLDEIRRPDHPQVEARRLIALAREGALDKAITRGEALLERHPDLDTFRGHLAHWYRGRNALEDARRHYETLIARRPDDAECARLLADTRARLEQNRRP